MLGSKEVLMGGRGKGGLMGAGEKMTGIPSSGIQTS